MGEVATRNPAQELVSRVRSEQFQQEVAAALPENIPAHRFVRATATALLANPEIAKLESSSVFQALLRAAQDGLLPDGREAALVAFGGRAAYIPMVAGLRKIAAEHGWSIRSAVVYENDEFEYEQGDAASLRHRPARLGTERGEAIGAYAVATHRDGRREFEVMDVPDIEKVRSVSRAKDRGPWVDWWARMAEKTPVRRLFSKLALDPADAERVARVLDAAAFTPEQATAALYGAGPTPREIAATTSTPAPSADTPGGGPTDGEGHAAAEGDEQASGSTGPMTDAAAGSSADDDPEPTITGFQVPEKAIDEAGATVIPKGDPKGKTLVEIAGTLEGQGWLGWALRRKGTYWPEPFRVALELFVEHRLPDVWATYVAEREAA